MAHASRSWAHPLSLLTCAATLILIWAGGLVTSLGAGLAVPDWPTTFGHNMFLFPWSKMVGGVFVEHSHRLIGSLVGILTVLTTAAVWWEETRRWVQRLAGAALALVVLQGVLGGMRVILIKLDLAIVHACVAQLFFGVMVSLALVTSPGWHRGQGAPDETDLPDLRRLSLVLLVLVYVQTIFGAVLRHTGTRLDAHLLFGALVAIHAVWVAVKAVREYPGRGDISGPAHFLWVLLALQVALGAASYLAKYTYLGDSVPLWATVILTSAHVVCGALLFSTVIVICLRLHRTHTPALIPARGKVFSGQASA